MTVYFISDGEYVKIGYTNSDPKDRLAGLQTGNARHLQIIHTIPGNISKEQALHQRFQHLKVRGEWFKFTEEIQNFIVSPEIQRKQKIENFYVDLIGLDINVDAWFQRFPKDKLNKLLIEVVKCCEQSYRRGFQQGFDTCKKIIANEHPVAYKKSQEHWHGILLKDSSFSLNIALKNISSQICSWRLTYDYHKATVAPTTFPKGYKIHGMETAMERHCHEFQNASSFMFYLSNLN